MKKRIQKKKRPLLHRSHIIFVVLVCVLFVTAFSIKTTKDVTYDETIVLYDFNLTDYIDIETKIM